ncbi:MAG: DNA mismatch repair protein MutS [Anaerolineae bacterium]|nr:DNA mismatch repair protein MutS [Anaerolineae bacterium]
MTKLTPSRQQYLDFKKQFPDSIVMFRLGDFYEMFDDDARTAARELDLVLTGRPVSKGERVPMCGVPHHAVEGYIARLVERGYHVAVVEQVGSEPVNGLTPREVSRVITPGTVMEPGMLPEARHNYLLALVPEPDRSGDSWAGVGLAYADISTGEFAATQVVGEDATLIVVEELARLEPREVLLPASWAERGVTLPPGAHVTPLPDYRFSPAFARDALIEHFEVTTLDGFGLQNKPLAMCAAGAILDYVMETQRSALEQFTNLRSYSTSGFMTLDPATRRNLELTATIRGGSKRGSLLDVLDRTVTPMGARLLRTWIGQPLLDVQRLEARLEAVAALHASGTARAAVRDALRQVADLERLVNRLLVGRAGPRDLQALAGSLEAVPALRELIAPAEALSAIHEALDPCPDVVTLIGEALVDDPPATLSAPGVFRRGYSQELDQVIAASRDAKEWVAGLEETERERAGIKSLKVGFNRVFGYYIEVSKANADKAPADYIRKQTLVNAERYITPELKEYESLILNAEERLLEIEGRLFAELCSGARSRAETLLRTARALAHLDAFASLAEVAAREKYARPTLTEEDALSIHDGRHPVVEKTLRGERFVPNDTHFDEGERLHIITGPNMAGKSTIIRQVALIVLMAQIGSFVPAREATIGLADRIFTRIGAQDEIHAGQSTFMVEMVELALILTHATRRSLIILDEIGRGTSTYDGMAIARAVVEFIHNNPRLGARTLFATHYHELTELANLLPGVVNYNVAVAEEGDSIVFLHRLLPGGTDRSYGIHVAQLAGIPRTVVNRATEILKELEAAGGDFVIQPRQPPAGPLQLSFLQTDPDPIVKFVRELSVDELSPLDAITKLYELKRLAGE